MQRKTIWMPFLLTGISFILIFLWSCEGEEDCVVKGRYVYLNNSGHSINVNESFTLAPGESHTMEEEGLGGCEVTSDDYISPILGAVLIFDDNKCDTLNIGSHVSEGEGIVGIKNYESTKLGERYYKFTYTFKESDFLKADDCQ